MRRLVLAALVLACDPGDSDSDTDTTGDADDEPHAAFAGKVDIVDLCGVQGANVVSFRATRVGCAGAGPCTLQRDPFKTFVGDAATCPSGQSHLDMAVGVAASGRYQIEARTLTDSGFLTRCYGARGETTITVSDAQLAAGTTIRLSAVGGPCPHP